MGRDATTLDEDEGLCLSGIDQQLVFGHGAGNIDDCEHSVFDLSTAFPDQVIAGGICRLNRVFDFGAGSLNEYGLWFDGQDP
ncbi:hypothetical protein E3A20_07940 [Planctomyces bekefii]|uniref:Uncharacterized protein n=1 Tax=Planctomyces bekefii TaxID=1653850 RepID=A0A5C6M810_9PLAN|nr:hypothetical protein E3A20_07940 [Planctomyces bekefii]